MLEMISFLITAVFFMSMVSLYQHYRDRKPSIRKAEKKIKKKISNRAHANINELWLLEQGYIEKNKIYNIISRDSGKTWYVVEHGIADAPNLALLELRHIQVMMHPQAWSKLKNYVKQTGPISLKDEKGVSLLEKAGFEVRIRK